MEAPSIIVLVIVVIAVWALIALVIGIALGRTASAGDTEARMSALVRDVRAQDAGAASSLRMPNAAAPLSGHKTTTATAASETKQDAAARTSDGKGQ